MWITFLVHFSPSGVEFFIIQISGNGLQSLQCNVLALSAIILSWDKCGTLIRSYLLNLIFLIMKSEEEEGEESGGGGGVNKTTLVVKDFSMNPSCPHGPTVLLSRDGKRFFGCSAFRSRKLCDFHMKEDKWMEITSKTGSGRKRNLCGGSDDLDDKGENLKKKKKVDGGYPLEVPTQRDKGEAQYHFTQKTVEFFVETFQCLEFDGVLCVGTPSLHEHISRTLKDKGIRSFLLDIDGRFGEKYTEDFALYNMCNHYFFGKEEGRKRYVDFLKCSKRVAVVTDPPFGVKVEILWNGSLKNILEDVQSSGKGEEVAAVEFFWIFPYFMEGHILRNTEGVTFRMSDFKVTYRNHKKFSEKGSCGKPSAVRIFTTVPLSVLRLPEEDSYRFCGICDKWVDKQNIHCKLCKACTTKDGGSSYRHCKKCKKCVKSTWIHCDRPCGTCHLQDKCINTELRTIKRPNKSPSCNNASNNNTKRRKGKNKR